MMAACGADRVEFLNCFVDNVSIDEVFEIVASHIKTHEPGYMVSLNVDICITLEHDKAFRCAYDASTLALIDSKPLFDYARRGNVPLKTKLSGSDLMDPVCEWAAQKGLSCYFLGGVPGVAEKAAHNLMATHQGLRVVGTMSPDRGFELDEGKSAEVVRGIRTASPDILFMCCGAPKSEKFLYEHLDELAVPFSFSLGAAIDFAAGKVNRAPKWVSRCGFEWLYRFFQEPERLFKRYFVDSWEILGIIRKHRSWISKAKG